MKKLILFVSLIFMSILLSGCGSSSDNQYDYENDKRTTLFLVDDKGFTYGGIPYKCDSMTHWSKTKSNGEFTFVQPDTCIFNFNGLRGLYGDGYDDVVLIVDYTYSGKGNIPYTCQDFGASSTYSDGSFSYNENDECTFYL